MIVNVVPFGGFAIHFFSHPPTAYKGNLGTSLLSCESRVWISRESSLTWKGGSFQRKRNPSLIRDGQLKPIIVNMAVLERLWVSTRAQGGTEGKEGVLKPPFNMKRLRIATTGHGAASWQFLLCWTCHSSICFCWHNGLQNQSLDVICNGFLRTMCFLRRLWQRTSRNVEETW